MFMEFKDRLKELRKERGLTQEQLADALELSKSAISMYECGRREPDFDMADLFADYFNVDFDYMVGKDDGSMVYMDRKSTVMARKLSDRPNLQKLMDYFTTLSDSQLESIIALLRIGEDK